MGRLLDEDDVIDALNFDTGIIPFYKERRSEKAILEDAKRRINNLPSAQPEKGEWIDVQIIPFTNNDGQLICEKICSRCHGIAYFRSTFDGIIANNFCPNCGKPMKRGEQDEINRC